jgi:nuclear pore complex protein Nup205
MLLGTLIHTPKHLLLNDVTFPAYIELVLLSVRIITTLSASPAFAKLTMLIERSVHSERILNGFAGFLKSDSTMNVTVAEAISEQHMGASGPDVEISLDLLEQPSGWQLWTRSFWFRTPTGPNHIQILPI